MNSANIVAKSNQEILPNKLTIWYMTRVPETADFECACKIRRQGIASAPSYLKCTLYMYMPCPKCINQRKRRGEGGVGEKDSSTTLAMAIKLYLDSA